MTDKYNEQMDILTNDFNEELKEILNGRDISEIGVIDLERLKRNFIALDQLNKDLMSEARKDPEIDNFALGELLRKGESLYDDNIVSFTEIQKAIESKKALFGEKLAERRNITQKKNANLRALESLRTAAVRSSEDTVTSVIQTAIQNAEELDKEFDQDLERINAEIEVLRYGGKIDSLEEIKEEEKVLEEIDRISTKQKEMSEKIQDFYNKHPEEFRNIINENKGLTPDEIIDKINEFELNEQRKPNPTNNHNEINNNDSLENTDNQNKTNNADPLENTDNKQEDDQNIKNTQNTTHKISDKRKNDDGDIYIIKNNNDLNNKNDNNNDLNKTNDDDKNVIVSQDTPNEIQVTQDTSDEVLPRSLNTILADIMTNHETNEPVNVTRAQMQRVQASGIKIARSFANEALGNKNVLYNIFSIAPTAIFRTPINFFRKVTGALLTSRKTKENLKIVKENLDNLSISDLEILEREYKGNTLISARGLVGIDTLIQERIQRFRYERIELKRAQMKALYDKVLSDYSNFRGIDDLLKSITEHTISESLYKNLMMQYHVNSEEELIKIIKAESDEYLRGKTDEIKQIRELRTEIDNEYSGGLHGQDEDFRAKGTKMNETGKRFAKNVSTGETYEFTRTLGQLEDAEKAAIAKGDNLEALKLFVDIEKKQVSATEQKRSIFGWRETGLSNYQPIPESLDYRPDPFIRNLLTTISAVGLTVGVINEIQNRIAQSNANANAQAAQDYQNAVNQHNQTNSAASAHNMEQQQTIHARGQEMEARSGDISKGMASQTSQSISGRRAVDEYADNDVTNWTHNSEYHALDDAHHAATQQAADIANQQLTSIQSRLATGQITDVQALREMQTLSDNATKQFVDACKEAIPISKQYAAQHTYEYSGYIENLERFVANPDAIKQLNEAAIRSVEIGGELQGINILPYQELAEQLQYLPVNIRSQLFALGSAALLTAGVASQAESYNKKDIDYNEELTQRILDIDEEDKKRGEPLSINDDIDDEEIIDVYATPSYHSVSRGGY